MAQDQTLFYSLTVYLQCHKCDR